MLEVTGEHLKLSIYDFDHLKSIPIDKKFSYKISTERGTELVIDLDVDQRKIQIEYYEKFHLKEKKFVLFKDFIKLLLKESNEQPRVATSSGSSNTVGTKTEETDDTAKSTTVRTKKPRETVSRKKTEASTPKKSNRRRTKKQDS